MLDGLAALCGLWCRTPLGGSFSLSAIGSGRPVLARFCPLPGGEDSLAAMGPDDCTMSLADLLLRNIPVVHPGWVVGPEASATGWY